MLVDFYATKRGMTQVWDQTGRRIPATILEVADVLVLDKKQADNQLIFEIGIGRKKLKNAKKPLRAKLEKSGFSFAPLQIRGVHLVDETNELKIGSVIKAEQVLKTGEVVDIQGVSKGRGFAGAIKRHGFHGGPKTHGQSDRARAVGSIGAGTTPGRVLKGKKMPGHYGVETKTVQGLTILYFDPTEKRLLVSGPVPGHFRSIVRIHRTGKQKEIHLTSQSLAQFGSQSVTPPSSGTKSPVAKDKVVPTKVDQKNKQTAAQS